MAMVVVLFKVTMASYYWSQPSQAELLFKANILLREWVIGENRFVELRGFIRQRVWVLLFWTRLGGQCQRRGWIFPRVLISSGICQG